MKLEPGSRDRLLFNAGQELGIRVGYMARAKLSHGRSRAELVRLARHANHEMLAYFRAVGEVK